VFALGRAVASISFLSMGITEKDALVTMRIKFVTIWTVIMNKRNTTKDFVWGGGGNGEGIFARKQHL
jgi:hypothetical protein